MTLQLRFNPFTGTFDYVDIAAVTVSAPSTPVVMSADLTIPTQTQILFRVPITVGSFKINGAAGSVLVGV